MLSRTWVVALILLTLFNLNARAEAPPTLRLATWNWPPFSGASDKPHVATEIVHEALRRAGFTASSNDVPNADFDNTLRKGNYVGTECAWQSKEREKYLLYSAPYMENRLVLLGRRGADVSAKTLGQLRGKKIGVTANYAYGEGVRDTPGVTFVDGSDLKASLQALIKGTVDYVLIDELVVHYLFEQHPLQARDQFIAGTHFLITRSLHFALRKDFKQAATIIDRFNQQLRKMLADGSYNRLLGVKWIRADTDGDGKSELILAGTQAGTDSPTLAYAIGPQDDPDLEAPAPAPFLIEGKQYDDWSKVPDRYKVPTANLGYTPVYVGIPVVEF
jgi:polar amino acid transport system substrate-binding protein